MQRMYDAGLGGILDTLGNAVETTPALTEAIGALISYVGMIDDGQGTAPSFLDEFKAPLLPGDYGKITAAFATGAAPTIVADWWEQALAGGGRLELAQRFGDRLQGGERARARRLTQAIARGAVRSRRDGEARETSQLWQPPQHLSCLAPGAVEHDQRFGSGLLDAAFGVTGVKEPGVF
jgi:hypothetical protein